MYKFKSTAAGDLIMMKPVGDQILAIIGREPGPQGIIESAALPAAIAALEQAIAVEQSAQRSDSAAEDDDSRGPQRVGLQQRAWPMIEMMKRAAAEKADIVWGV